MKFYYKKNRAKPENPWIVYMQCEENTPQHYLTESLDEHQGYRGLTSVFHPQIQDVEIFFYSSKFTLSYDYNCRVDNYTPGLLNESKFKLMSN